MRRLWFSVFVIALLWFAALGSTSALAQANQPQTNQQSLTLFTRYPAQEIATGDTVTFPLILRTTAGPQLVHLELQNLPDSWTATFRGDGKVILILQLT